MGCLLAGDLNTEAFLGLVNRNWPEHTLIMAFSPAEFKFGPFRFDKNFLAGTDQGRIFSEQGELKWRRVNGGMRVVYLGEDNPPDLPGLEDESVELDPLEKDDDFETLMLWRIRTDTGEDWEEGQTQQYGYPVTAAAHSGKQLGLLVENRRDASGLSVFSRYVGVEELP